MIYFLFFLVTVMVVISLLLDENYKLKYPLKKLLKFVIYSVWVIMVFFSLIVVLRYMQ